MDTESKSNMSNTTVNDHDQIVVSDGEILEVRNLYL